MSVTRRETRRTPVGGTRTIDSYRTEDVWLVWSVVRSRRVSVGHSKHEGTRRDLSLLDPEPCVGPSLPGHLSPTPGSRLSDSTGNRSALWYNLLPRNRMSGVTCWHLRSQWGPGGQEGDVCLPGPTCKRGNRLPTTQSRWTTTQDPSKDTNPSEVNGWRSPPRGQL